MTTTADKLIDIIRTAVAALPPGADTPRALAAIVTRAHTAATIAAVAERDFGGKVRALLSKIVGVRALPKADRTRLAATIATQLKYLAGFVADAPTMSDAAIAARAQLYAGAARGTFYATRYTGLPAYPGDGSTPCLGNCKCSIEARDDGLWWVLHPAEHCSGCLDYAAGSPYAVK